MNQVFEGTSATSETSILSSDSGGELDLAKQWLKHTVQNEVLQGAKLREEKLKLQTATRPFNVFAKPPSLARSSNTAKRKSSPSPYRKDNIFVRERPRSNSPSLHSCARARSQLANRETRSEPRPSSGTSRRQCRTVCSMRTAELAVPSKRKCIETWRSKADVLPGFMVNRLKQHVMDQTPIVKVSDAVIFFKCNHVVSKSRQSRKINKEVMKNRNYAEIQNISAIFGHKIAQKLIKPMKVTLNSQLQNMASIITDDICSVLKDKQKLPTDDVTHQQMLREIAEKVTIWVANILEDASEKLLEEDLRVKKMNERTLRTEEELTTLIGMMVRQEAATEEELTTLIGMMARQEAELEELEGPVLDIIDDLVDDVLTSCLGPEPDDGDITPDYLSVSSGNDDVIEENNTVLDDTEAGSPVIKDTDDGKMIELKSTPDEVSLKTELMNQINEIIDGRLVEAVKSDDITEKLSKEFGNTPTVDAKRSESFLVPLPEIDDSTEMDKIGVGDNLIDHIKEEFVNEQAQNSVEIDKNNATETLIEDNDILKSENEFALSSENNIDDNNETADTNNGEQDENVSDEFKILPEELSEERNRKVQFSREHFDTIIPVKRLESKHSTEESDLYNKISTTLTTNDPKPEITLGQPNEHLLSDVDEPWPASLSLTVLKPSASVNKSITSLGKILESDEKFWLTPEEKETQYIILDSPKYNGQFLDAYDENDVLELDSKLNDDSDQKSNKLHEICTPKQNLKDIEKYVSMQVDPTQVIDKSQKEPTISVNNEKLEDVSLHTVMKGDIIGNQSSDRANICGDEHLTAAHEISSPQSEIKELNFENDFKGPFASSTMAAHETSSPKSEIKELNIENELKGLRIASSTMVSELQKYGDKLQDIISIRELSKSETPKMHTPQFTSSKNVEQTQKGKLTCKMHQELSSTNVMAGKKFDYNASTMKQRERDIRKSCQNLDNILLKLEKWQKWLQYITKYINTLKQKAEIRELSPYRATTSRSKSPRSTEKDMWTKLNQRAKGNLKLYRNDETIQFKITKNDWPAPMPARCVVCGCKKQMRRLSPNPSRK